MALWLPPEVCLCRWEVGPCCPSAGCHLRASSTASSAPRVMCGALGWCSGRSSPMESSPGTNSPTLRSALPGILRPCPQPLFFSPLLVSLLFSPQTQAQLAPGGPLEVTVDRVQARPVCLRGHSGHLQDRGEGGKEGTAGRLEVSWRRTALPSPGLLASHS